MKTLFTLPIAILILLSACAPNRTPVAPGTIPISEAPSASATQSGEKTRMALIEKFGLYKNPQQQQRVESIVAKLLPEKNRNQPWTITLLDNREVVNAAAAQGNQLFVWRGMLEKLDDDRLLASVFGHEIAHVLADHVNPRPEEIANRVLAGLAGTLAGTAAQSAGYQGQGAQIAGSLASAVVQGAVVNPYSQKLELEADMVGMFLMADAGYDPRKALEFWSSSYTKSSGMPQFFSTHPPSEKRLKELQKHLPQALIRYSQ